MNLQKYLHFSPKIGAALRAQKPVVALCGSALFQGETEAERLASAQLALNTAAQNGAEGAILHIWQGKLCIGLTQEALAACCALPSACVTLTDLPRALCEGQSAVPSAAAALFMAALGGVHVLAYAPHAVPDEAARTLGTLPIALVTSAPQNIGIADAFFAPYAAHNVPVYALSADAVAQNEAHSPDAVAQSDTLSANSAAAICRVKWDLGLASGACFCTQAHSPAAAAARMAANLCE